MSTLLMDPDFTDSNVQQHLQTDFANSLLQQSLRTDLTMSVLQQPLPMAFSDPLLQQQYSLVPDSSFIPPQCLMDFNAPVQQQYPEVDLVNQWPQQQDSLVPDGSLITPQYLMDSIVPVQQQYSVDLVNPWPQQQDSLHFTSLWPHFTGLWNSNDITVPSVQTEWTIHAPRPQYSTQTKIPVRPPFLAPDWSPQNAANSSSDSPCETDGEMDMRISQRNPDVLRGINSEVDVGTAHSPGLWGSPLSPLSACTDDSMDVDNDPMLLDDAPEAPDTIREDITGVYTTYDSVVDHESIPATWATSVNVTSVDARECPVPAARPAPVHGGRPPRGAKTQALRKLSALLKWEAAQEEDEKKTDGGDLPRMNPCIVKLGNRANDVSPRQPKPRYGQLTTDEGTWI